MSQRARCLVTLAFVLAACGAPESRESGTVIKRADQPDMVYVDDEDSEIATAISEARSTLADFVAELAHPQPGASYGIKVRFDENDATEFIWLSDVAHVDGAFQGIAGNQGVDVDVQVGQAFTVSEDRVVDWLIVAGGKYRGGYTVRVIRDRMSPEDQERTDEQVGAVPESRNQQ